MAALWIDSARTSARIAGAFVALTLVGLGLRPLGVPAWESVRAVQPELRKEANGLAAGQGAVLGVLGGFRSVTADLLWIRLNTAWEKQDRQGVEALAGLVTWIDPRPTFFWMNAARILAYDVPIWRVSEEGGRDQVPEARVAAINREQAEQALGFLRRGLAFQPGDPLLHIEVAQVYLNRLEDLPQAADWFGRASRLPGAPPHAVRMQAELLRLLDRPREALEVLAAFHSGMEPGGVQAASILERIRLLEDELDVPDGERYRPRVVPNTPGVPL